MLAVRPGEKAEPPRPAGPATPAAPVQPGPEGQLSLLAELAEVHGTRVRYERESGMDNIGYWTSADDYVTWWFQAREAGFYRVELTFSCNDTDEGSTFVVAVGSEQLPGKVRATGTWRDFQTEELGRIHLSQGKNVLVVWPKAKSRGAVMNLREIRLTPVK
jgi:hypothetical protein